VSNLDHFLYWNNIANALDSQGHSLESGEMLNAYTRRNMFDIEPEKKIYRIFQRDFLEYDMSHNIITLPVASAGSWEDPLENPLANVSGLDEVSGASIDYGALVRSFHALCWTQREKARSSDWSSFSHGKPAIRITTTAGKLMQRLVRSDDSGYMHRTWLVNIEYVESDRIQAMQNLTEVLSRIESTGTLLVLTAAMVRTTFQDESEVRLIFDRSLSPLPSGVTYDMNSGPVPLVRIPFDWADFIENSEDGPFS